MSTATHEWLNIVSYNAPHGWSDLHPILDQLAKEHPRDMMKGRWKIHFNGIDFIFTWIDA